LVIEEEKLWFSFFVPLCYVRDRGKQRD
jgi:hypothetical protein